VWLEANRIISTRRRRIMSVQKVQQELAEGIGPSSAGSFIAELAWLLGERIADVVDRLDTAIETAEDSIADQPSPAKRSEFAELRRKTAQIRLRLSRETRDNISAERSNARPSGTLSVRIRASRSFSAFASLRRFAASASGVMSTSKVT
jgi:zinc transporter